MIASIGRIARPVVRRRRGGLLALAAVAVPLLAAVALAAPTGKLRGRILASDSGVPVPFADVVLLTADSTFKPVGGLTNSDGTFLLEAPPGFYSLRYRALAYAPRTVLGVKLAAGEVTEVTLALDPEAIIQKEIVVEARSVHGTENALLAERRKAVSMGDAVSAEQVRRSPDKDAGEVLRRVTGVSVSSGKYVFVRGLGERYSSTEVDGVRIASPEQNKRVVPLDLVPASLLENVVVQKTYTADRPGEFGGGDVQVHTKDFPGARTWSFSLSQGETEGVTFHDRLTYASTRADLFGFGADARRIPDAVYDAAGQLPLTRSATMPKSELVEIAKAFRNVWSPTGARTVPNAGYSATYGDEFKLLGRRFGVIESWSFSRSFSHQSESQRFYSDPYSTTYDYAVRKSRASVQLGGLSGLSVRLSPRHTLHLRGLYTNSADDEVRLYEGPDYNNITSTGAPREHRGTRLLYVQRNVLSGTLEGQHEFPALAGTSLDWKVTRSQARRLQPDRRETVYDRFEYDDGTGIVSYWGLASQGRREYGDLRDQGWGTSASAALPYALGSLGHGRLLLGADRQTKQRRNFYRRFNFSPYDEQFGSPDSPEIVFGADGFVEEATLKEDNYEADQRVSAGFMSLDVPLGRQLRANAGVRVEHGYQDVRTYYLFEPGVIYKEGRLDNTDWLPSGNLTWALTTTTNLRLAASHTLSRPDLNELSPSPALEYVGGVQVSGNPELRRARIDNYDVRLEAFPALSEVLAAGFFYKSLHQPIEQVVQGGAPPTLVPRNTDSGRNLGVELEARTSLGRLWGRMNRLSLNANASVISSRVQLPPQSSETGTTVHPLQGQARYLANVALTYASAGRRTEVSVLMSAVGRRLNALGLYKLPDIYEQPTASLDATLSASPLRAIRIKIGARNLLDTRIQQLQAGREVSGYRIGRSYSMALSYGS